MEKTPEGPGSGFHITGFCYENHLEDQPKRRDLARKRAMGGFCQLFPDALQLGGG